MKRQDMRPKDEEGLSPKSLLINSASAFKDKNKTCLFAVDRGVAATSRAKSGLWVRQKHDVEF